MAQLPYSWVQLDLAKSLYKLYLISIVWKVMYSPHLISWLAKG